MSQARPLPPGVERRNELRLQRRNERLRNGWRMLVLLGLSAGLGTLLLREGWTLTSAEQVEVGGSRNIDRDTVIRAAGLEFPQPLLSLEPQGLAAEIKAALPVRQVRVSRWMAPARLRVDLVDREPVAAAQRSGPEGLEQGYVDHRGYWMSASQARGLAGSASNGPLLLGWQERHRPTITALLQANGRLKADLRQIRFEPTGMLTVQSARLGEVRLGPSDHRLTRRLEVLEHLIETLPPHLQGKTLQVIDLTEPEQPELALKQPPKPAAPAE